LRGLSFDWVLERGSREAVDGRGRGW